MKEDIKMLILIGMISIVTAMIGFAVGRVNMQQQAISRGFLIPIDTIDGKQFQWIELPTK